VIIIGWIAENKDTSIKLIFYVAWSRN